MKERKAERGNETEVIGLISEQDKGIQDARAAELKIEA